MAEANTAGEASNGEASPAPATSAQLRERPTMPMAFLTMSPFTARGEIQVRWKDATFWRDPVAGGSLEGQMDDKLGGSLCVADHSTTVLEWDPALAGRGTIYHMGVADPEYQQVHWVRPFLGSDQAAVVGVTSATGTVARLIRFRPVQSPWIHSVPLASPHWTSCERHSLRVFEPRDPDLPFIAEHVFFNLRAGLQFTFPHRLSEITVVRSTPTEVTFRALYFDAAVRIIKVVEIRGWEGGWDETALHWIEVEDQVASVGGEDRPVVVDGVVGEAGFLVTCVPKFGPGVWYKRFGSDAPPRRVISVEDYHDFWYRRFLMLGKDHALVCINNDGHDEHNEDEIALVVDLRSGVVVSESRRQCYRDPVDCGCLMMRPLGGPMEWHFIGDPENFHALFGDEATPADSPLPEDIKGR